VVGADAAGRDRPDEPDPPPVDPDGTVEGPYRGCRAHPMLAGRRRRERDMTVAGREVAASGTPQRMTALDSWFLHIEDEADHMHIGSVGVFEGPPPSWPELEATIGAKLDQLPRYRQRVHPVPLALARPVWADDPHFQLEYHLRHTALPAPGGLEELRNLVGRVMSQQLDRRRPLWELWFIEGVGGGRWAMLSKVHHCMVDGIAGTDLLAATLEDRPDPTRPAPEPWEPTPEPGRVRLVRDAAVDLVREPTETWRSLLGRARRPKELLLRTVAGARGSLGLAGVLQPMPASDLTGPIGPHRRWGAVSADLARIKEVRRALGGTVNDVVLAAITAGYRDLLAHREALTDDVEVRTMVPVSLRTPEERGGYHNRVTAMFVSLPVAEPDPAARYAAVLEATAQVKRSGEPVATAALVGLTGIAPAMFVGVALRSVTWLVQRRGQPFVSTVTTNVPGPQAPWYLLGRRLLEAYPYVPIGEGLRTGIAIFSYDGQVTFGVTADYDAVPDVDILSTGIADGIVELVELATGDRAAAELSVRAPLATAPRAGTRARASRRGSAGG
jgi:diacylglycerol O-acyltransferase / wax synthase